jgi:cytochrome P450
MTKEKNSSERQLSDEELAAQGPLVVLAATETTLLVTTGILYNLLKNPRCLKLLQAELRGTFRSYSDINATSTAPLKYLQAVIEEGLRTCPVMIGFPRITPKEGAVIDGHFIPPRVCSACSLLVLNSFY